MSLYDDLGVPKDADSATIKRAYRKQAHKAHPDKGGTVEKFHAVQRAWDVLGDERRRAEYDRTGKEDAGQGDTIEERALKEVGTCIVQAVEGCPDIEHMNIVEDIRAAIKQRMQKEREAIKQIEERIRRHQGAAKRVRRKKGAPNILAQMIEANIGALRRAIEMNKEHMALGEAMLKILKDYDYAAEPGNPRGFVPTMVMSFTR